MWTDLAKGLGLAFVLLAPFIPAYASRNSTQTPWIGSVSAVSVLASIKDISGGYLLAVVGGGALLYVGIVALRSGRLFRDQRIGLALAPLPVGVVLLAVVSLVRPLFVPRYLIFVLPFMILAVAHGIDRVRAWRRWLAWSVLAVLLVVIQGWPVGPSGAARAS